LDKSSHLNTSNNYIFDKKSYFEEINKINLEDFSKELKEKKLKFEKKQNLILPIINQVIELTEYIGNYQEQNDLYLIDNSKWDELMQKFKENEKIDENEEKNE
jgi:hypothetical protein